MAISKQKIAAKKEISKRLKIARIKAGYKHTTDFVNEINQFCKDNNIDYHLNMYRYQHMEKSKIVRVDVNDAFVISRFLHEPIDIFIFPKFFSEQKNFTVFE